MTLRRPRMERDASGTVFLFRPLCFFPSFLPSPTRFVRPFFPTLVRPSREEFLKINIGAKRGGAAKKFDIPFASFLFTFLSSVRFFSATRIAQSRASSPYGPQGEAGLFESTRSSRKRIHEGSGCANLRAPKKRGRVYFLRSLARARYSPCCYWLNNFLLLYASTWMRSNVSPIPKSVYPLQRHNSDFTRNA